MPFDLNLNVYVAFPDNCFLREGEEMTPEYRLVSPNGYYEMSFLKNGDLIISLLFKAHIVWRANVNGIGNRLFIQVLYTMFVEFMFILPIFAL